MAINNVVNIDDQLSRTKEVHLAGKDYEVKISDNTDRALTKLTGVDLPKMIEEVEKKIDLLDEDNNAPDYNEYFNFVESNINEVRDKVFETLDEVLGEDGAGKEVYDYYNQSTKTLLNVVDLLQGALNDVMEDRTEAARQKYQNRNQRRKKTAKK